MDRGKFFDNTKLAALRRLQAEHLEEKELDAVKMERDAMGQSIQNLQMICEEYHLDVAEHRSPLLLSDILPIWENTPQ